MKYLTLILLLLGAVWTVGCAAKHRVDTSKLASAFATASGETKAEADQAIAAIKGANYDEALTAFGKVIDQGNLSADQQQALRDALVDIQVIVLETPSENTDALNKKIEDLNARL